MGAAEASGVASVLAPDRCCRGGAPGRGDAWARVERPAWGGQPLECDSMAEGTSARSRLQVRDLGQKQPVAQSRTLGPRREDGCSLWGLCSPAEPAGTHV